MGIVCDANSKFPVQTIQFAGDWPHHIGNWRRLTFAGSSAAEASCWLLGWELMVLKVLQWKSDWDVSGPCHKGPVRSLPVREDLAGPCFLTSTAQAGVVWVL